jgi:hypothetical protein
MTRARLGTWKDGRRNLFAAFMRGRHQVVVDEIDDGIEAVLHPGGVRFRILQLDRIVPVFCLNNRREYSV